MNKVGEHMSSQLFSIKLDGYAYEAVDEMYNNNISALLVEDQGEYVGIITKTDWMHLNLKGECDPREVKISSLMTKIINTIDVNQTVAEAGAIVEQKGVRHIPVTREGKIVGMFSVKDLENYYLKLHKKTDF